jgi:hypothetical protein
MAKKVERRKRVYADTDRRLNEHSSGDSLALKLPEGVERFKPKDSEYNISIIPFQMSKSSTRFLKTYAKPGQDHWEQTYFAHFGVGPNESTVCCPAKNFGKPCPICEHHARLRQNPKVTDKELSTYRAKERQLFWVFDHDDPRKGLQLWEIANFNFGKQLDTKLRKASEKNKARYKKFWHIDDGLVLRIVGTEESAGKDSRPFTKFTVDEFNDREEELPVEVTEHDICLDELPQEMSYEKLKKLFLFGAENGEKVEKDEDDDSSDDKEDDDTEEDSADDDDNKEDDDKEEDDKEEEEDDAEGGDDFAKGDTVMFRYKGKRYVGDVVKVDTKNKIASVLCEGEKRPNEVDWSDLTKLEPAEDDDKEADEEKDQSADDWGDDDDDKPAVRKTDKSGKKSGSRR